MIKKVRVTDIRCPRCNFDEIQYTNEAGTGAPRHKLPGWFCYGCRKMFRQPKRVPNQLIVNKETPENIAYQARGTDRFKPKERA